MYLDYSIATNKPKTTSQKLQEQWISKHHRLATHCSDMAPHPHRDLEMKPTPASFQIRIWHPGLTSE
jgi:hypothetical protein